MSWSPFLLVVVALISVWHGDTCPAKGHHAATTTVEPSTSTVLTTESISTSTVPSSTAAPFTSTAPPTTETTPTTASTTEEPTSTAEATTSTNTTTTEEPTSSTVPSTIEDTTTTIPATESTSPATTTEASTTSTAPPTTSTPSTALTTEAATTSTAAVNNSCRCPPLTQYNDTAPSWSPNHGNLSVRETVDGKGCSQMTVTCAIEGKFEVYMFASFSTDILITPTGTGQGPVDNCGVMNVVTGFDDVPIVCKDGEWYYTDKWLYEPLPSVGCVYSTEVPC